jgi:hypothetical protein
MSYPRSAAAHEVVIVYEYSSVGLLGFASVRRGIAHPYAYTRRTRLRPLRHC